MTFCVNVVYGGYSGFTEVSPVFWTSMLRSLENALNPANPCDLPNPLFPSPPKGNPGFIY